MSSGLIDAEMLPMKSIGASTQPNIAVLAEVKRHQLITSVKSPSTVKLIGTTLNSPVLTDTLAEVI